MKYILWTGGWDSTFRLLQLASDSRMEIQPIYVHDAGRAGRVQEQQAMQKILAMIAKDKRFTANVHPLKVYDKDFILQNYPDSDITNSWKALNAEFALGGQYEWLALLCKQLGIQAELGLVGRENDRVASLIERGKLVVADSRLVIVDNCSHSRHKNLAYFFK